MERGSRQYREEQLIGISGQRFDNSRVQRSEGFAVWKCTPQDPCTEKGTRARSSFVRAGGVDFSNSHFLSDLCRSRYQSTWFHCQSE